MMSPVEVKKTLKIVVCGQQEVGKTSLVNSLTNTRELFDSYTPTIGVEYKTRYLLDREIKLAFWDLSGDEKFEKITVPYTIGSSLIIFMYDTADLDSVYKIKYLHDLYRQKLWTGDAIIVGNNLTLENNKKNYITNEASEFCKTFNYPHFIINLHNKKGMQEFEVFLFTFLKIDKEQAKKFEIIKKEKIKKKIKNKIMDIICFKKCNIM